MAHVRSHLIIEGRVQGVWFRDSTRREASRLNITGWVKNRYDGNVELVAEGSSEHVKELTAWCHIGPPAAEVANVKEIIEDYTGEFDSFEILY
jgi:acylphosphatase